MSDGAWKRTAWPQFAPYKKVNSIRRLYFNEPPMTRFHYLCLKNRYINRHPSCLDNQI